MLKNKELLTKYNIFCKNVRYYRKLQLLTQEQLAEKSDLSISYIKQIESCKEFKNVSMTSILKISKALGVDVEYLFSNNR